jgi:hypothetical protein
MKYWLIVFLFSTDGSYESKDVYQTAGLEACQTLAGEYAKIHVNSGLAMEMYCVTDDHYMGRSTDENIPLD